MSIQLLTGPEIAPKSGAVKQLVIFLHGLGSNGEDLISLAPMMDVPDTHFVSPNAPFPFDMGGPGFQWFPLTDRDPIRILWGIQKADPILNHYIDSQMARFKLTPDRVALVGFSQGSMMSLYTAPHRKEPLGAVVGLSGALSPTTLADATCKPPICLIHGEYDEVVPFAAMRIAEQALKANQFEVEAHARPMLGHGIDPEGIDITTKFLRKSFGII